MGAAELNVSRFPFRLPTPSEACLGCCSQIQGLEEERDFEALGNITGSIVRFGVLRTKCSLTCCHEGRDARALIELDALLHEDPVEPVDEIGRLRQVVLETDL